MAMVNVIPELWAAEMVELLQENLVSGAIANTTIAQKLQMEGDQFHIPVAGEVTTSAYDEATTTINYEDPTDTVKTLTVDQDFYGAIKITHKELKQANQDWQKVYAKRLTNRLLDRIDTYVFSLYGSAGITSFESGSTDWALGTSGEDFDNLIADLHYDLDSVDASTSGRYMVGPPNFVQAARLHAGARATALGDDVSLNGLVSKYMGMDIYMSNNLTNETSTNHGLCGIAKESIALAVQIDPSDIEVMPLEGKFAMGIRARALFGGVVYRPTDLIDVSLNETLLA